MFQRWLRSFWWALHGVHVVWREENNFRIEVFVAIVVLMAALIFNFTYTEFAMVLLACIMVLGGEIVNTAIEDVCNKIEPKEDAAIGKIKDTMAAFVLLSALGAVLLGLLTIGNHFLLLP